MVVRGWPDHFGRPCSIDSFVFTRRVTQRTPALVTASPTGSDPIRVASAHLKAQLWTRLAGEGEERAGSSRWWRRGTNSMHVQYVFFWIGQNNLNQHTAHELSPLGKSGGTKEISTKMFSRPLPAWCLIARPWARGVQGSNSLGCLGMRSFTKTWYLAKTLGTSELPSKVLPKTFDQVTCCFPATGTSCRGQSQHRMRPTAPGQTAVRHPPLLAV